MAASAQNSMLPQRPVLDEGTFQQLLAAAYVLQEHNDRLNARKPPASVLPEATAPQQATPDYSQTLSEIVETQTLIHSQQLDLQASILLIAQRVQAMTKASAVAVGMIEETQICYRAATGAASRELGLRVPVDLALSAECVHTGHIVQYPDLKQQPVISAELSRRTATRSLIAVPVFHEGGTSGVLEVRFAEPKIFHEHDVRTCQLMAGLIAEAMNRAAEVEWKRALAAERASMLEVLERLKPQLDRLASQPAVPPRQQPSAEETVEELGETVLSCRGCGESLGPDESFCGVCGTRVSPGGDIQSKWASMWHLKEAADRKNDAMVTAGSIEPADAEPMSKSDPAEETEANSVAVAVATPESESTDLVLTDPSLTAADYPWASASHARKWLDSVSPQSSRLKQIWQHHRAKIYVGVAAALLVAVMSGWGAQDLSPRQSNQPKLTLFEQTLVTLGIAEAPPAPHYAGNLDTAVWEDVHTATYYCPGADLYGKTPGGKYATQREAQQEQFEPASRKVCR